ncbi:O-antigen translocase [Gallaecimonas kandeliae]|uniref:O-antigen translocase n=1 Tax=Gallaecimonas kandeliae TaxID=3029055 RepID=UPI0026481111|nr:O-antigen translocase [Gallaecimonas kandeliae]WKE66788.1 O-antigen translocase [Gallaecimonas kandeliae]
MKKMLKVTALTGLFTFLKMAIGFVIGKVVAIYTGPSGIAVLGQFQSFSTALNGFVNAPVSSGVIRYTAENMDDGYEACSSWWKASIFWVALILMAVVPTTIILSDQISLFLFNDKKYNSVIIACVLVLPFVALGTLCSSILNGFQQYRRYVFTGMTSVVISGLLMLLLIISYGLIGALLAAALQYAFIGVFIFIAVCKQPWCKLRFFLRGFVFKPFVWNLGGYTLMAVTSALAMPVALVFVRNLLVSNLGWEDTGLWQAVWKVSEVYLGVITMALGTYYLPRLSSAKSKESFLDEIKSTFKFVVPVVLISSLAIYLLRDFIISILFTSDFNGASNLFLFQLLGDNVKIASWVLSYPVLSKGAVRWFVVGEIIFSISLVCLSSFFVQEFGLVGANMAYLVNYAGYFLFMLVVLKNVMKSA